MKPQKKKIEIPNINTVNQYHIKPEELNIFTDMSHKKDDNSITDQFKRDLVRSFGMRKQM